MFPFKMAAKKKTEFSFHKIRHVTKILKKEEKNFPEGIFQ